MDTNKKIALVTGASSGFGLELVNLFARDGYNVILVARTESELHEVAHTKAFVLSFSKAYYCIFFIRTRPGWITVKKPCIHNKAVYSFISHKVRIAIGYIFSPLIASTAKASAALIAVSVSLG